MKFLLKFLSTLILLNILFYLYLLIYKNISYPFQAGPQFDDNIRTNYQDYINENHPSMVLIGDSMLQRGVNSDKLGQELNQKILNIALPGSGSTLWYLIIKNDILLASTPPAYLVLFFRDSELTAPGLRVQGQYLEQIDEFAASSDQLLIQRAYINQMNPMEIMAEKYFPTYSLRWKIRSNLDYYIRYSLPTYFLACSQTCTNQAMARVFGENNLEPKILSNAIDAGDDYLYTNKSLNFNKQVEISFLPEIIRLCRENHIQLVAVQMKTLRFSKVSLEPPTLKSYRVDLKEYLQKNNAIYLDFSNDSYIHNNLFFDPLHFNDKGKEVFTDLLAKTLTPHLR